MGTAATPAQGQPTETKNVATLEPEEILGVDSNVFAVGYTCILTACPRCGNPVPLNGLLSTVACPECRSPTTIPVELWQQVLEVDGMMALVSSTAEGHLREHEEVQGPAGLVVKVERVLYRRPICLHCRAPLGAPDSAWSQAAVSGPCPSCGQQNDFVSRPPFLPGGDPLITHVAAEEHDQGGAPSAAGQEAAPKGAPVAMSCPSCGAGLTITGDNPRTTPCEFCGTSVYLPEELWRQLHPVKQASRWVTVQQVTPEAFATLGRASGGVGGPIVLGLLLFAFAGTWPLIGTFGCLSDFLAQGDRPSLIGAVVWSVIASAVLIGTIVLSALMNRSRSRRRRAYEALADRFGSARP